jgi:beta-N-acetylhexosaminidase
MSPIPDPRSRVSGLCGTAALLMLLAGCAPRNVPVASGPVSAEPPPATDSGDMAVDTTTMVDGDAPAVSELIGPPTSTDTTLLAESAPGVPGAETADSTPRPLPESILAQMSLREKAGQMIMPVILGDYTPEGSASFDRIVRLVTEEGIGGVIVSVGSPIEVAAKLNELQRRARVPLLVAADLETGAGFRLRGAVHVPTNIDLGGATDFPSLMAVGATGDPGLAHEMGRITALEARAVGIQVPFAPVLDVNSNPDNPIINTRSFGEDPTTVALLGSAFIRGIEENGALATGKHFPGHGDTDTDSHLGLPIIRADRTRLDSMELRPFRSAVDAGMSAIMTAHIAVPALNGGNGDPSTLSRPVLTGLLREEMGFHGLVFTDAMDMGAIDRGFGREEATIRAVEAGADVILMPPSPESAIEAIVRAVDGGRIPEERIDSSVLRLLRAKERMGLLEDPTVSIHEITRVVGIPAHLAVADEIARRSITLLRNDGDLLPLLGTRTARVLSVTYRRTNDLLAGRTFDQRLRSVYPRLTTEVVERDTGAPVYEGLLRQAQRSQLVVVSLYVTAVSYSGSVALPEEVQDFIQELAHRGVPHVVVSFGNPYLLADFPDARAYILAWSGSQASQRAAAGALFGDFDITGRTPTRLPPFFEIGDGIQLRRKGAGGG